MSDNNFPVIYWGSGKSTAARFTPLNYMPTVPITSCFVVAITPEGKIAIARPKRGWGLPGGHVENNESAEDCVRREAAEECGITLGKVVVIGGWLAKKIKETSTNLKYPKQAYQLLYLATIDHIDEKYKPQYEILERSFVSVEDFPKYHHDFVNYEPIYIYILQVLKERKDWLQT